MQRTLITVADERLFLKGYKYCFLTEGCLLVPGKEFSPENAFIYPPYGVTKNEKDKDRLVSAQIEGFLYSLIVPILNDYHKKNFSEKLWRVLLGKWLRRYVDFLINRFFTLEYAVTNQQFDFIPILNLGDFQISPVDSLDFVLKTNYPEWNHMLLKEIIQYSFRNEINTIQINSLAKRSEIQYFPKTRGLRGKLKKIYHKILSRYSSFFHNKTIFILNSYLPTYEELLIQLKLFDVPVKYLPIYDYKKAEFDENLRLTLTEKLNEKNIERDLHLDICIRLFFKLLPKSFLEDFRNIEERIHQSNWPKKPKIIFTSNNFDFDEVFKLYTGIKMQSGAKYIIGQHGNNYGTYRYMYHTNEEKTADAFLTWGWKGDLDNQIQCFLFKRQKNSKFLYKPLGKIVLIQLPLMNQFETWDLVSEHRLYFENQLDFVSKLPRNLFESLIIRLHRDFKLQNWNEPLRWKASFKDVKLDFGIRPIYELTNSAKLVIHSYDSTGLLETLYANIPTMAFWLNSYDHLQDSVVEDYKKLEQVGIIHLSADSLAKFIQNHWETLDIWWCSEKVQNARITFCHKYARSSCEPVSKIARELHSLI
jgi:putative transferase (TIGR04331 family)